jgi:hypothetical protein
MPCRRGGSGEDLPDTPALDRPCLFQKRHRDLLAYASCLVAPPKLPKNMPDLIVFNHALSSHALLLLHLLDVLSTWQGHLRTSLQHRGHRFSIAGIASASRASLQHRGQGRGGSGASGATGERRVACHKGYAYVCALGGPCADTHYYEERVKGVKGALHCGGDNVKGWGVVDAENWVMAILRGELVRTQEPNRPQEEWWGDGGATAGRRRASPRCRLCRRAGAWVTPCRLGTL